MPAANFYLTRKAARRLNWKLKWEQKLVTRQRDDPNASSGDESVDTNCRSEVIRQRAQRRLLKRRRVSASSISKRHRYFQKVQKPPVIFSNRFTLYSQVKALGLPLWNVSFETICVSSPRVPQPAPSGGSQLARQKQRPIFPDTPHSGEMADIESSDEY